jgi:hypothetical protein
MYQRKGCVSMENNIEHIEKNQDIQSKIYTIRGLQVMLDSDLANLYDVESKRLNEQVKRNIERFPEKFRFQLTEDEYQNLKSQFATSSLVSQNETPQKHGGRRYLPYVFTEQGVSMLSAVLKSKTAIEVSIKIMDSFVSMRKFISFNNNLFQRLDAIEKRQLGYELKSDEKFEKLFEAIEQKELKPSYGIFYDGQMFDAYAFISDLIRGAKSKIVLIDNYIDDSVLTLFSKNQDVDVTIYTHSISKQLELDLQKYNAQYKAITIKSFKSSHDRFMIVDNMEVYHIGASLKDLGKKWFAFSKIGIEPLEILENLHKGLLCY